jgi:hypothetical protein
VRLAGVRAGDIVQVDRLGRVFHAVVTGTAPGGLQLAPLDRRITYRTCRSRDVIGHWLRQGRPRESTEELEPTPAQLTLDVQP